MLLVRAYALVDSGGLTLDERVTIGRPDWRHGSGVIMFHDPGLAVTWRDLLTEMVITSDNTATDLVLQRIGGVAGVNAWLGAQGYGSLKVIGRPHEYRRALLALIDPQFKALTAEETTGLQFAMDGNALFEAYKPLFTGPKAAWVARVTSDENKRRFAELYGEKTSDDPAFWLGSMTPRETARLLEGIERNTAASPASCAAMRLALRRQQLGARRLPHFITVPVAHKTGDGGRVANDAGIIYARSGPVVVAFFSNAVTGSYAEAEDRIGRLGSAIVQAVDGSR
jgi:beta-lactamase class A